jgi:acyl-CoA reductase-like NAD-dependent aldehyde dehydrogenase
MASEERLDDLRLFAASSRPRLITHTTELERLRKGTRVTTSSVSTLINPATEEVLRTVDQLDVPAVDDAVARAKSAQKLWAKLPPAGRAAALRAFAAQVDSHVDELAALEVANSGHVIGNAEWEAGHVRDVLQFYSASPERLSGKQIPVAGGSTSRSTSRSASSP